jgi:Mg2+/citrate symporter
MGKQARFALVACLFVLATAVVLSVRYPNVYDALVTLLKNAGDAVFSFIQRLVEAFRAAAVNS